MVSITYTILAITFLAVISLLFPRRVRLALAVLGLLSYWAVILTYYPPSYDLKGFYYVALITPTIVPVLSYKYRETLSILSLIMLGGTLLALNNLDYPILFLAGLEMSIVASYAAIALEGDEKSLDAAITYLVTGTVAVVFIAIGLLQFYVGPSFSGFVLLATGILLELAQFPFYSWAIRVIIEAPLPAILVSFTVPKLPVIALLFFESNILLPSNTAVNVLEVFLLASILVGGVGGLYKLDDARRSLAYGSLLHLAIPLIIVALHTGGSVTVYYLTAMFLSEASFIIMIYNSEISRYPTSEGSLSNLLKGLVIASMVGAPPFSTLVSKVLVVKSVVSFETMFVLLVIMLIISLPMAFIYYTKSILQLKGETRTCVSCTFLVLILQVILILILPIAPAT